MNHFSVIMAFFTPGCPTLHGVASCVDYCTAYMGAWAGVTALYERETRVAIQ